MTGRARDLYGRSRIGIAGGDSRGWKVEEQGDFESAARLERQSIDATVTVNKMAEPEQTSVKVSALGATLEMFGGNATFFFLLLLLGLNIGLTFYEHILRSGEHEQIMCSTKLAIFIYTSPRTEKGTLEVNWERLPVDLYGCLPKFIFDRKVQ